MKSIMRVLLPLLLAIAGAPVAAQVGDEQTRDHERQDRRYYERQLERQREPDPDAEQAQRTRREAFLARAEELVKDKNFDGASSEHYRVQTDDPRLDPEAATALLESFREHFAGFWKERRVEAPLPEDKSRVFLFYSFYKYNQLLAGDWRFSAVRPKGHYINAVDVIAAHSGGGAPEELPDSLVHEAAHQLVDRGLFDGGYAPPPWLSEGLASYFGYTWRDAAGAFQPPRVGDKGLSLFRGAPARRAQEPAQRLREVRRALSAAGARGEGVVGALIRVVDPGAFYSGEVDLNYGLSWLLVHFLLHGDEGRHAEGFVRYLRSERDGSGGAEAFFEATGLESRSLDAALLEHLKQDVKIR